MPQISIKLSSRRIWNPSGVNRTRRVPSRKDEFEPPQAIAVAPYGAAGELGRQFGRLIRGSVTLATSIGQKPTGRKEPALARERPAKNVMNVPYLVQ
jgi:hypothetical protein